MTFQNNNYLDASRLDDNNYLDASLAVAGIDEP